MECRTGARQFHRQDFDDFDRIFVMDRSNYYNVVDLAENEAHKEKVHLLLDALEDEVRSEVPDPYYDGGFDLVFDMINRACDRHIELLSEATHN